MPHDELFRALSLYESGRDIASGRVRNAGIIAALLSVPELSELPRDEGGRWREAAASFLERNVRAAAKDYPAAFREGLERNLAVQSEPEREIVSLGPRMFDVGTEREVERLLALPGYQPEVTVQLSDEGTSAELGLLRVLERKDGEAEEYLVRGEESYNAPAIAHCAPWRRRIVLNMDGLQAQRARVQDAAKSCNPLFRRSLEEDDHSLGTTTDEVRKHEYEHLANAQRTLVLPGGHARFLSAEGEWRVVDEAVAELINLMGRQVALASAKLTAAALGEHEYGFPHHAAFRMLHTLLAERIGPLEERPLDDIRGAAADVYRKLVR